VVADTLVVEKDDLFSACNSGAAAIVVKSENLFSVLNSNALSTGHQRLIGVAFISLLEIVQ